MARRRALVTGVAVLAVALSTATGCSKDAPPPPPTVTVTDPSGALPPGVTVAATPESTTVSPVLAGTSAIGGPVRLAASDGSTPGAPLEVTFAVDGDTAEGHGVVAVHLDEAANTWTPTPSHYNHITHLATVTTSELGVWDVLAWDGGVAGPVPAASSSCGSPPSWVSELETPTEDPALPVCVEAGTSSSTVVTVTNQHNYPVTVRLGGATPTVVLSKAPAGETWGRVAQGIGGSAVHPVVGPGETATLTYARPAVGADPAHVDLSVVRDPLSAWVSAVQAGLSTGFAVSGASDAAKTDAAHGLIASAAKEPTAKTCAAALTTVSSADATADTTTAAVAACLPYWQTSLTASGLDPAAVEAVTTTMTALGATDVVAPLIAAPAVPALTEVTFTMTPPPVTVTRFTVDVKGCFASCTFWAYSAADPAHTKDFGTKPRGTGTLTWSVPVDLTHGLVLQIGGPKVKPVLVVFQYTGVVDGTPVSPKTAAEAGSGIGCWVGTGRAEVRVTLRVVSLGRGTDGRRAFAAWVAPGALGLGTAHPAPKGALAVIPSPCT